MGRLTREQIYRGLAEFDKHLTSTVLVEPAKDGYKVDCAGLIEYAKEKYNGDIDKMTKKEKMMFFYKK
jgi:hypothetical protein